MFQIQLFIKANAFTICFPFGKCFIFYHSTCAAVYYMPLRCRLFGISNKKWSWKQYPSKLFQWCTCGVKSVSPLCHSLLWRYVKVQIGISSIGPRSLVLCSALSAGVLLVIDLATLLTIWAWVSSNTVEKAYPALTQICLDGLDGSAWPVGTGPGWRLHF